MRRSLHRTDSGFVTIEFVAGVALLLLPTALFVLTLPTWFERQEMTRVAAREAARTYVLSGNEANAREVVQTIGNNYDLQANDMTVTLAGDPDVRGSRVEATVTTHVPLVNIPIFKLAVGDFDLTSRHSEAVDLYRSRP